MDVFHVAYPPTRDTLPWPRAVLAVGNFDGVHLGHQALLAQARVRAEGVGPAVALTFDPHPSAVLGRQAQAPIMSLARRLERFAACGMDAVVVYQFSRGLAALPSRAFVHEVLLAQLRAAHVVVGHDFCYGQKRLGTVVTLAAELAEGGAGCDVIPAVSEGGAVVSSSRIRERLAEGQLDDAALLLGAPYDIDGVVVHGAKRGRQLGFPTANVATEAPLGLPLGVYVTSLHTPDGVAHRGVASLGRNTTFGEHPISLEVHLLGFQGDLYDQRVRVVFHQWLRGQATFASLDELIAAIRTDVDAAHRYYAVAARGA